jgi:transcriptional regulator GlxA family with amidase domain
MEKRVKVGIFVFNEVEVLDFAGPFEVFSLTKNGDDKLFEVIVIGETHEPVTARNGLKILPAASFTEMPDLDILIIPGGYGAEEIEIKNRTAIKWIIEQQKKVKILASVCTGALLLAECGLLNNKKATTHWMDLDRLEHDYPNIEVVRNTKFVDEGDIITSGGISAGINMSFHVVSRLFGSDIAKITARRMEYDIEL